MKKSTRIAARYYGFLKSHGLAFKSEATPPTQPETKPLDKGCDYPLFKLERVSPEVIRRRAIVRG